MTSKTFEAILNSLEDNQIAIESIINDWEEIGNAIADELGEKGRQLFHRYCQLYPVYNATEADSQYDTSLRFEGTGLYCPAFLNKMVELGIIPSIPSIPSAEDSEYISDIMEAFPDGTDGSDGNDGNDGNGKIIMPTFYPKVKGRLPCFLEQIAEANNSDADADMLILGSLGTISACLPNIYGIYDRKRVFANLYIFVTARAGTGKGRLRLCKSIVNPIHNELRVLAEEEEKEYRKAKDAYKRQRKNGNLTEPIPPPIRLLFLPANSSSTAIYQALKDNNGKGLLFETEADTLTSALGQDFGDFSDGLRKAFHHESISYLRRTQREYVEINNPQLSVVLSGTQQQVFNLISSVENGLFSRFLFLYLDNKAEWLNVIDEVDEEPLDAYFGSLGDEYYKFYQVLKKLSPPIKVKLSSEQGEAFNRHFSRLQADYLALFGDDTVASVRRLALSTFRIAMILTALRIEEDGDVSETRTCTDEDYQTAMAISEVLQQHMLRVIKELPSQSRKVVSAQAKEPLLLKAFWDSLPEEFDAKKFKDKANEVGLSIPTAERYVKQWLETRLDKVSRGLYRKRE